MNMQDAVADQLADEHQQAMAAWARAECDMEDARAKIEERTDNMTALRRALDAVLERQAMLDMTASTLEWVQDDDDAADTMAKHEEAKQEEVQVRVSIRRLNIAASHDNRVLAHMTELVAARRAAVTKTNATKIRAVIKVDGEEEEDDESVSVEEEDDESVSVEEEDDESVSVEEEDDESVSVEEGEYESEYEEVVEESGFVAAPATTKDMVVAQMKDGTTEEKRAAIRAAVTKVDFCLTAADRPLENLCLMCDDTHTTKDTRAKCDQRANVDALASTLLSDRAFFREIVGAVCDRATCTSVVQRGLLLAECEKAADSHDATMQDHVQLMRDGKKQCPGCRIIYTPGIQVHIKLGSCAVRHLVLCLWRSFTGWKQPATKPMAQSTEERLCKRLKDHGVDVRNIKVLPAIDRAPTFPRANPRQPKNKRKRSSAVATTAAAANEEDEEEEEVCAATVETPTVVATEPIRGRRASSRINASALVKALMQRCRETAALFNEDLRSFSTSKERSLHMRTAAPMLEFHADSVVGECSFRLNPAGDSIFIAKDPIPIEAAIGAILADATGSQPISEEVDALVPHTFVKYVSSQTATASDDSESASDEEASVSQAVDEDDDMSMYACVDGGGGGVSMDEFMPPAKGFEQQLMEPVKKRAKTCTAPPPPPPIRSVVAFAPPPVDAEEFHAYTSEQDMVSRERYEHIEGMLERCLGAMDSMRTEFSGAMDSMRTEFSGAMNAMRTEIGELRASAGTGAKNCGSMLSDLGLPPSVHSSPKVVNLRKSFSGYVPTHTDAIYIPTRMDEIAHSGSSAFAPTMSHGRPWEQCIDDGDIVSSMVVNDDDQVY